MKKKLILMFMCVFTFFICNIQINAESYKCVYNYKKSDDSYKVTVDIDSNNKTTNIVIDQTNCTFCWKYQSAEIIDFLLTDNEEISQQTLNNIYSGKCDSTLMVFRYWSDGQQQHYFQMLFNDTLEAEAIDYMQTGFGGGTYIDLTYGWLDFSADESTAPASDIVYKCDKYDELYEQLGNTYKNIQSCKGNCSSYYSQYSSLKDQLSKYCKVQMKYLSYGKSCLSKCLNLSEDLKNVDISKKTSGECGISGRLIIWIANIVRWLKYIIPVAVIVLGILDFMKTIGADKEDEMKKAQQRFIRRLIAAALIFIIPFILEFVLNKMGFSSNGCGIINL